jgi:hypothetical protein
MIIECGDDLVEVIWGIISLVDLVEVMSVEMI